MPTANILQIGPHRWSYRRAVDAAGLYRAIGLPVPEKFALADIGLSPNEIKVRLLSQNEIQESPDEKTIVSE